LQVLMVCMGNICRSPTAEAVLRARLQDAGLDGQVLVDSAGLQDFHRGAAPDPRAVARAALRGYRLDDLRARPVVDADFARFDLLLAMDRDNLQGLVRRCPVELQSRLGLLLQSAPQLATEDVPDPYFGSLAGFDHVLDLVEPACLAWVPRLRQRLSASDAPWAMSAPPA
jgi:protein-tyrosine phosphatase